MTEEATNQEEPQKDEAQKDKGTEQNEKSTQPQKTMLDVAPKEGDETDGEEKPITEKPEDLSDKFWDEENKTFKGNLLYKENKEFEKRIKGLREKVSKGLSTGG